MCLAPIYLRKEDIYVKCGKCFECRVNRSDEWAWRVTLESQLYSRNCMITLTYNNANLPKDNSVSTEELSLFVKRLRRRLNPNGQKELYKIRFFGCGEYGDLKGRPHMHIIIFNYDFPDKYFFCFDLKGSKLFRSPLLESCWDKGFSTVGEVTQDSAKYCAVYLQKQPKDGRKRAFVQMSRRPGIGADAVRSEWLASGKMYLDGRYKKIPRYFLDVLEREGHDLTEYRAEQKAKAKLWEPYSPEEYKNLLKRREKIFSKFKEWQFDEKDIKKDEENINRYLAKEQYFKHKNNNTVIFNGEEISIEQLKSHLSV